MPRGLHSLAKVNKWKITFKLYLKSYHDSMCAVIECYPIFCIQDFIQMAKRHFSLVTFLPNFGILPIAYIQIKLPLLKHILVFTT